MKGDRETGSRGYDGIGDRTYSVLTAQRRDRGVDGLDKDTLAVQLASNKTSVSNMQQKESLEKTFGVKASLGR